MTFSFFIFVFVFVLFFVLFCFFLFGLFVFLSFLRCVQQGCLCLMIFLCPFVHCKALRTAMYKRFINSIIIIIIIKFSCKKTLVNMEKTAIDFLVKKPLLIWPARLTANFFWPLVTVLTGFHCNLKLPYLSLIFTSKPYWNPERVVKK